MYFTQPLYYLLITKKNRFQSEFKLIKGTIKNQHRNAKTNDFFVHIGTFSSTYPLYYYKYLIFVYSLFAGYTTVYILRLTHPSVHNFQFPPFFVNKFVSMGILYCVGLRLRTHLSTSSFSPVFLTLLSLSFSLFLSLSARSLLSNALHANCMCHFSLCVALL